MRFQRAVVWVKYPEKEEDKKQKDAERGSVTVEN